MALKSNSCYKYTILLEVVHDGDHIAEENLHSAFVLLQINNPASS